MAYEALDFMNVDADLTDEERVVRDTVRGWVEEPRDAGHRARVPRRARSTSSSRARWGRWACSERRSKATAAWMGDVAYGLICQELERGDSGVRFVLLGAGLARDVPHPHVRLRGAEAEVAAEDGPRRGDRCFGLTEPDFGSDPAA